MLVLGISIIYIMLIIPFMCVLLGTDDIGCQNPCFGTNITVRPSGVAQHALYTGQLPVQDRIFLEP